MTNRLPVTVAIPTIGRPELLRECLASLRACEPGPDDIVVVDQSLGDDVIEVVEEFESIGARISPSYRRGVGRARNRGLVEAKHDWVLFTDDDCTVAPDWVERAAHHMAARPGGIVTGRVQAAGDPKATPSLMDDPAPRDYSGTLRCNVLASGNMAVDRRVAMALGGFDESLPAAEDNDLCYRWLRAGRPLRYEPDMVVWHNDWRSPRELAEVHRGYASAQGQFYGKHLRGGDLDILRFLIRDLATVAGGVVGAVATRKPLLTAWRRGMLPRQPEDYSL